MSAAEQRAGARPTAARVAAKTIGTKCTRVAKRPALTIWWDAEIDYARKLLADIEPLVQLRRAHELAGTAPTFGAVKTRDVDAAFAASGERHPRRAGDIRCAIRAGEWLERMRIIRWLVALEGDDSYEWGRPIVLADRLYAGAHRQCQPPVTS